MFTAERVKLLVVTCAALFMAMLDNLVLGVALPSIQASFHAEISDLEWFMNAYTLAFAVLLIPFSMLGDRFGRKRIFLIGTLLFTAGSIFSGLSANPIELILARCLQGIGGAAIVPLSLVLVNGAFPEKARAAALGIWSGISGLGLAMGPLVGGLIIEGAPWKLIFWVNVPVGLIAFLLGLKWLPESKGNSKPLDVPGIWLLGAGLFGLVLGLERGNSAGWSSAIVLISLIGGMALLLLFYVWERSRKHPLVNLGLFRRRSYTALVAVGFCLNAGIFGAIFLLTLFLQQAQGYSALGAGIREMVWTGCTMIAAPLAGLAISKLGTKFVLSAGLLLQAAALAGFAVLIIVNGIDFPFGWMAPFMMMAGTGMGLSFTPLSHGLLGSVPDEATGEASGIGNATRELGGVFGIALCTLIFEWGAPITSDEQFGSHTVPALLTGSGFLLLAAAIVLLLVKAGAGRKKQAAEPAQSSDKGAGLVQG